MVTSSYKYFSAIICNHLINQSINQSYTCIATFIYVIHGIDKLIYWRRHQIWPHKILNLETLLFLYNIFTFIRILSNLNDKTISIVVWFFYKLKTAFLVYGGFGLSRSRIFHSWRRHHYRWGADNFFLYSELMAIEQRLFFSVPHLLWQGTSLYMVTSKDTWNSHLLPPRRWRRGLERWHSKRKVGCSNLSRDKPKS